MGAGGETWRFSCFSEGGGGVLSSSMGIELMKSFPKNGNRRGSAAHFSESEIVRLEKSTFKEIRS